MHFPQVLVLGATGRIGRILQVCWANGAERIVPRWQTRQVVGQVVGQTSGQVTGMPPVMPTARTGGQWVRVDPLADPDGLARAAAGCDVILCLSGVVPGRGPEGGTGDLEDNTRLALSAIRAGQAVGARVLLASSAAVYGNQTGRLGEDTPLRPTTDYGLAKAEMETRAQALGRDLGVAVCALRIGNIAGVDVILGGWAPGFRLDQFADGHTPRRSYIGVSTLARVLGDLVATQAPLPAALNIAGPGVTEMGALLDAAGLAWIPRPAPETAIARVALDVSALQRVCRIAPETGDPAQLVAEWALLEPELNILT